MADKNHSDSDDSDGDYVPDAKDGNVSEEDNSGDAESDLELDADAPKSKRRRKTNEGDGESKKKSKESPLKKEDLDVNAIWEDFKKDANELKKVPPAAPEPKKEVIIDKPMPRTNLIPTSSKGGGGGGLAGILGKLGKKDKVSVLEKSRLDWNSFKRAEGIDADIQKHNRGKDGFLEKRDFLERADVRQFELEKEMRTLKRSTR